MTTVNELLSKMNYTEAEAAHPELFADVADEHDFVIDGEGRFIHKDAIDDILTSDLESDEYLLGCFADWLLADILGCPVDVIKTLQKNNQHGVIGEWVSSTDRVAELAEQYVRHDGYGAHFNPYDGSERTCGDYYFFEGAD